MHSNENSNYLLKSKNCCDLSITIMILFGLIFITLAFIVFLASIQREQGIVINNAYKNYPNCACMFNFGNLGYVCTADVNCISQNETMAKQYINNICPIGKNMDIYFADDSHHNKCNLNGQTDNSYIIVLLIFFLIFSVFPVFCCIMSQYYKIMHKMQLNKTNTHGGETYNILNHNGEQELSNHI